MMNKLNAVKESFGDLEYMQHREAEFMRDFIVKHDSRDILEIGFYHGKSSAYFAAILEDLGRGHLVTIDLETARQREPNIEQVLSSLELAHRVTPVFVERSYTWEMAKMIRAQPRPLFDLCYFDGGHTWDGTGFGFVLVDMLLRPGGWIIFDDLEWTIDNATREMRNVPKSWRVCSPDERATAAVGLVFQFLVPHLGYEKMRIVNGGRWGIARKPLEESGESSRRSGKLARILPGFGRH